MDDFELRDMLTPPMRYHAEALDAPVINNNVTAKPMDGMVLAMAYVPMQSWQDLYEPEEAMPIGTIFKQLNLPFEGGRNR